MAYLQVTENDLEIGDVLSITSDNGNSHCYDCFLLCLYFTGYEAPMF